jgi:hypothetical protein
MTYHRPNLKKILKVVATPTPHRCCLVELLQSTRLSKDEVLLYRSGRQLG